MHFYYLDETGCSGADLTPGQEPIFVLGGISVKDQGWVATTEMFESTVRAYFDPNPVPEEFELHAHELLSPNGEGPFEGHNRADRNQLALELLDIIASRSHHTHYVAIDKGRLDGAANGNEHQKINCRIPYLIGFDYITTLVNQRIKDRLGHTARGMIILDEKEQFDDDIRRITRFRRFQVPRTRRLKWLVEFSYSIDSRKHPMVQLSDLAIYCVKKFFEMDCGYRPNWPDDARLFYARVFDKVYDRVIRKGFVTQEGRHANGINQVLERCVVTPSRRWKQTYGVV